MIGSNRLTLGAACAVALVAGTAAVAAGQSSSALTQDLYVHPINAVAPVELYPYYARIFEISKTYMDDASLGSVDNRIRARNAAIRAVFGKLRTERTPVYQDVRQTLSDDPSCKGGRHYKSCPGSISFGSDYAIIPATLRVEGTAYATRPKLSGTSKIVWVMESSGGRKYGKVRATARLTDAAIGRAIDQEIQVLRGTLQKRDLPDDRAIDP